MSQKQSLQPGLNFEANHQPLYERVPPHDGYGRPLSDFMMLIPGLRELTDREFQNKVATLEAVLKQFHEVVFIDLNVPLNLLWVSVRAKPGVILDVATTVKCYVPEALLVGHKCE